MATFQNQHLIFFKSNGTNTILTDKPMQKQCKLSSNPLQKPPNSWLTSRALTHLTPAHRADYTYGKLSDISPPSRLDYIHILLRQPILHNLGFHGCHPRY